MAIVGCDLMPSVDERAATGPCTLALIVEGERLTPPYRVPLGGLGGRPPETIVSYDGEGWRGSVSMTVAVPGGRVDEAGVEARALNEVLISSSLLQPGTYHVSFDDARGCRQEFDIEAVVED